MVTLSLCSWTNHPSFEMSAESYVDSPINAPSVEDAPSMEVPQLPGVLRGGRSSPSTLAQETAELVKPASHELIAVSCYTRFDNLAHGPRGTEAKRSLYTFRLDENDGELVLYSVTTDDSAASSAESWCTAQVPIITFERWKSEAMPSLRQFHFHQF
eukprot:Skav205552  [mRNA]  locus=scaffold1061:63846:67752:- [translate_table: standard]